MGTHSFGADCPKCNNQLNAFNDTKSLFVEGDCLECGYIFWTEEGIRPLNELNEIREENDLKPISKNKYNKLNNIKLKGDNE